MNVLGIGTEIVECLRVAQMIERHAEAFISRVYTQHEIEYCSARVFATQHYAAHWAGKEAVLKAMGSGWTQGIAWRDIEIRSVPGGQPTVALAGGAREVCERRGIARLLVSISHCRTHAMAYALALARDEEREEG